MRWLAVVLALSFAVPASAKTLIVRAGPRTGASVNQVYTIQHEWFTNMLDRRGATYKSIPIAATTTTAMRTGLQTWGNGQTEQFDAVVIFGFDVNNSNPTAANPNALTLIATWPTVPVVFVGQAGVGAAKWTSSASCSTGVKTPSSYSTVYRSYVAYAVGTTEPFKMLQSTIWPHPVTTEVAGVTFRRVVAMSYSATTPAGTPNTGKLVRSDADSTGYTSAGRDTLVLWARYLRGTVNADSVSKPLIFVEQSDPEVTLLGMAMQMADSASGGNVWDKRNHKPIQLGLAITDVASRDGYYTNALDTAPSNNALTHMRGGVFCRADSCDTTNVIAGLDSLGTLAGLKTTFFLEPCSLATYPNVKNWLYRAGRHKVALQAVAGAGTGTTQIMGAADSLYPIDPLGRRRTRIAANPNIVGGVQTYGRINDSTYYSACSQASDTMLATCQLLRGWNILANYFGDGSLDRSILTPGGDWSPVAYTRAGGGPGIDSMAYALYNGKVRAVVIRPEWITSAPGVSSTFSSGISQLSGATSPGLDPLGYGPDARALNVYNDPADPASGIRGRVKIIAERGQHGMANIWSGAYSSHDMKTETLWGMVGNSWYNTPIVGHTHMFYVRTQILHVSIGRLGGSAGAATAARTGWYDIKHIHNSFRAANRLGWVDPVSGKQRAMFEWRYVSELEP